EGVLDAEPPSFLKQSYAELSPDGIDHYDVVVAKLAAMHAREPALLPGDLDKLACRCLIMVADDDEVRLEHAITMYRSVRDAELAVVPGTSPCDADRECEIGIFAPYTDGGAGHPAAPVTR